MSEYAQTVSVANAFPVVGAVSGPQGSVPIGAVVNVGASFTDPGTSDTHTASIDWGDGVVTGGAVSEANGSGSVSGAHSYGVRGTYTVRVTVTDDDGATGSQTRIVNVGNRAPIANAGGPYTSAEGGTRSFDGTRSSDPDGDVLTYDWDFGDGHRGVGVTPSNRYLDNGTYTVRLTVTDPGGLTNMASTTATVTNVAPVVEISPCRATTFFVGESCRVRTRFTDVGEHDAPWMYTLC